MNLLLDTNIVIYLSKDPSRQLLSKIINPDHQKIFVSIVSIRGLKSISLQNKWSKKNVWRPW